MLDRTIPLYNTILKCSDSENIEVELPEGFSIVSYCPGYEKEWARLECAIGDFDLPMEAEQYFVESYLRDPALLPNILFALDSNNTVVGSCIAWQDKRRSDIVSSLHWLVVDERYQRIGLGRALSVSVMNIYAGRSGFPVYIHTQPWSWKAILLYISLGFKLQKTDTFSNYVNEYDKAMNELGKILTEDKFALLQNSSEE